MHINITAVGSIVLIAAFSAGTGLVIHHNDQTQSAHAMMVRSTMEKATIMKAETSAAMKQQQSDEMAAHDAMMHSSGSTTSMTSTN